MNGCWCKTKKHFSWRHRSAWATLPSVVIDQDQQHIRFLHSGQGRDRGQKAKSSDLRGQVSRSVPDSIAVLGVDDDPLLCQLATPPLSSVIPDAVGAGYTAAKQLDAVMSGKKIKTTGTLLPPLGIFTRRSTDTLAVDDPDVALAARYILSHACKGIQVADVVGQTQLTRHVVEARFKSAIGKTPHKLIQATRLECAERLLGETSLTLDHIAHRCGLEYPEYLSVLFRKHRGTTPGQYRQQHRQP